MDQKNVVYENASQRKTYVGYVFDIGEHAKKEEILASLPSKWAELHKDGHIHIHDLDAYGLTYNCLTFDLFNKFPYSDYKGLSDSRKILKLFSFFKEIVSKVGNEQSGGMAFPNFDCELSRLIDELDICYNDGIKTLVSDCISDFLEWCNNSHERMGQVSYYITLNIGLADNEIAQSICEMVIRNFGSLPKTVFKPNIVFKVKEGINYNPGDRNYYLLELALDCSSRKMIPTYLLCDCPSDREIDPKLLSVMGCRTRVVDDIYGHPGAIGRGNIDNITINLPRLAFETKNEMSDSDNAIDIFKKKWLGVADIIKEILLDRYYRTLSQSPNDFPTVVKYGLWAEGLKDTKETFRHGTLSIGFIGLSEAFEILFGKRFYEDQELIDKALEFVSFMRDYTNTCRDRYVLNFSLLATSGELISGRFPKLDSNYFGNPILEKGYYTNSFHVNVDSGLTALEKIAIEGSFHKYCNGGSISYVELGEAPIGNVEGLMEMLTCAHDSGTRYLGFNYPLDICKKCGESGVFDTCPVCNSDEITRIRRVSGYLEILDYFVEGKKNEVRERRRN